VCLNRSWTVLSSQPDWAEKFKRRREGLCCAFPAPDKRLKLSSLEFQAEAELDPTAAASAVRWNELAGDNAEVLQAAG
jgi:hypothetical protein